MRYLKFDKDVVRVLEFMGFKVEDDNESASVEAAVSVIHKLDEISHKKCLLVSISLPCGSDLSFELARERFLKIAQVWVGQDEETMEHSHE